MLLELSKPRDIMQHALLSINSCIITTRLSFFLRLFVYFSLIFGFLCLMCILIRSPYRSIPLVETTLPFQSKMAYLELDGVVL